MTIKNGYKDMTYITSAPRKLTTMKGSVGAGPAKKKKKPQQIGGMPILPILAAGYAAAKAIQPGTKLAKALEENVSEEGKKKLAYKIPHKIASVMRSLGIGHNR